MTRERRNIILLIALLVVTLAGATWWWLSTHERVEQKYRGSPSKEARKNPLLAATRFLQELGIATEQSDGLNRFQQLPPNADLILGEHLGARLPNQRIEELLAWVENGGHLITSVQPTRGDDNINAGDRLLSRLGVYLEKSNLDEEDNHEFAVAYTYLNNGEYIEAEFSPHTYLVNEYLVNEQHNVNFELASDKGSHLLQLPYGNGQITLTTSLVFLHNPHTYSWQNSQQTEVGEHEKSQPFINQRDHAYILWHLVQGRNKVWLVRRIEATPLPVLFWRHAPYAVIALMVLTLFWLWWQYNRFGPVRATTNPARRNILEHILMSAVYAWRQDKADHLFATTRDDIERLLKLKHPQVAALPDAERTAWLADHCELPTDQILRVFPANWSSDWRIDWNGEREFIELTSLLQSIRKKL